MYRLFIVATRGDFAKIVGFSLAVKQNLLDESHVLKQIEDSSCRHLGVLAGIYFCTSQDLNIIVLKQFVYKKYLNSKYKLRFLIQRFLYLRQPQQICSSNQQSTLSLQEKENICLFIKKHLHNVYGLCKFNRRLNGFNCKVDYSDMHEVTVSRLKTVLI